MSEYDFDFGGRRGAIIIGINDYENNQIPKLKGCLNDAEELSERLKVDGKIDDHRILKDREASFDGIRNAIYDVLFKENEPCQQVIFYFSGHGFQDSFGTAYIAPSDFLPMKPYVRGIPMDELRRVFTDYYQSSTEKNMKGVCAFFDCCYSGKFVTGKAIQSDLGNKTKENLKAQGIVGLASMDSDEKSREKGDYTDLAKPQEHYHGIFTYHLIKGLEVVEADSGIITFDKLRQYMADQMRQGNQRLQIITEGTAELLDFEISTSQKQNLDIIIPTLINESKISRLFFFATN